MDKSCKIGLIYLTGIVLVSGTPTVLAQESADKKVPACAVHMVEPTQSGVDCDKVIDVVRNITRAVADHDYAALGSFMDENCSCYNQHTGKLVTGREAIVADVRANLEAEERRLKVPPIVFTVDHPYARVTGDTATVNFVLVKEVAGDHPAKYKSHCTDVLVKRNGEWKKLLFRGDDWKLVK